MSWTILCKRAICGVQYAYISTLMYVSRSTPTSPEGRGRVGRRRRPRRGSPGQAPAPRGHGYGWWARLSRRAPSRGRRGWSLRLGWHQFVPCLMRTYQEHSGKPSARIAVAAFSAAAKSWQAAEVRRTEGEREPQRSEEHTSELQSLMRISYAVFCLKK